MMLKNAVILLLPVILVLELASTNLIAADPAPASPPSSPDPAPASPPPSRDPAPAMAPISNDPAPANAPLPSITTDPAPASPPVSSTSSEPSQNPLVIADDPAPAAAPGSTLNPMVSLTPPSNVAIGKPFLGVGFRDPSKTVVTTLWSDSTATKLGIRLGDKIMSINSIPVENLNQIRDVLQAMKVGDKVAVVVVREKDSSPVQIGPLPLGPG